MILAHSGYFMLCGRRRSDGAEKQMKHVFVSYVRENHDLVDRLCVDLRSRGIEVWLDRDEILPGRRWRDAIREAIQDGAFFIACFSDEYMSRQRTYMNEELTLAIGEIRKRPTEAAWFIPVRLSECDLPKRTIGAGESLSDLQWVDLFRLTVPMLNLSEHSCTFPAHTP
jgi:hypothetical protein